MGKIGRYLDSRTPEQGDKLIMADELSKGNWLVHDGEGGCLACLVGTIEFEGFEPHMADAQASAPYPDQWMRLMDYTELSHAAFRYPALVNRFGYERIFRAVKMRAAKNNTVSKASPQTRTTQTTSADNGLALLTYHIGAPHHLQTTPHLDFWSPSYMKGPSMHKNRSEAGPPPRITGPCTPKGHRRALWPLGATTEGLGGRDLSKGRKRLTGPVTQLRECPDPRARTNQFTQCKGSGLLVAEKLNHNTPTGGPNMPRTQ